METVLIAGAVGLVIGFILGILVGRKNTKLVNSIVADLKALEAKVESLDAKKTTPVATAPTTGSTAITGSK